MTTNSSTAIKSRPLGSIEKYSSIRHSLFQYFAVIFSAVIVPQHDVSDPLSKENLFAVLGHLVQKYPSPLALTIRDSGSGDDSFHMIESVDLSKHLIYAQAKVRDVESANPGELMTALKASAIDLSKIDTDPEIISGLSLRLSSQYSDIESTPPWRLYLTPVRLAGDDNYATHVSFAYHHSLGDGSTGRIFLESLGKLLNEVGTSFSSALSPIVPIPETATLHPTLEQVSPLPQSLWSTAKALLQSKGWISSPNAQAWTGGLVPKTFGPDAAPYEECLAKASILRISQPDMARIIRASKAHELSVTATIVGLGTVALNAALQKCLAEQDKTFSTLLCAVPRNLRPNLDPESGVGVDSMGVYVCGIDVVVPISNLSSDWDSVWEAARIAKSSIASEVSQGINNVDTGKLKYVSSLVDYFRAKPGTKRSSSFEVSSIVATAPKGEAYTLIHPTFLQSASVMGAAINLSIMSFKGSDLAIGFTWTTGSVLDNNIVYEMQTKMNQLVSELE